MIHPFVSHETLGEAGKSTTLLLARFSFRRSEKRMPHGRGISSQFLNIFANITVPPFIRHVRYAFKFTKLCTVLLTAYVNAHKFLSQDS